MRSLLVFLFGVILLSSLTFAATYAVNGTGNSCFAGAAGNFSTIQSAINAAADGDTVIVCANGSSAYTENVNVIRSINLYGNQTRILVAAVNVSAPVFRVNSTYVNITNFTLSGATSSMGIWLNETSGYARIFNVNLTNNSRGIYVFGSLNNNFSNNFLNNNSAQGIELSTGSNNNRVENNIIIHSGGSGGGLHIGQAHNNTILLNTVFNGTNWNMFTSLAHNNTIVNNTFNISIYGVILQSSNTNVFANNTITGNTLQGLQIQGSASNNISSNTFGSSLGIGIYMYSASSGGNRIYLNTIANYTGGVATGIYVNETNVALHIYNNVLSNNTYGIYLNGANSTNITSNTAFNNSDCFLLYSTSNNTITSNTASNTYNGFSLVLSSNNTLSSNIAYNNSNIAFQFGSYSSNNNLTNNTVNYSNNAFYLSSSNNNTLISNSAYNNSIGFYLDSSSNNILTSNTAYNNSQPDFALSSSSNNTLTSNIASYSNYGFQIISSSNNNTFTYNIVSNNSYAGFAFFSLSSNNTLTSNTVSNNSLYGFYLYSGSNNTLTNNTASIHTYGFTLDSASNTNVLSSNIAYSNEQVGFYLLNQSSSNIFANNTAFNNSYGFYLNSGSNNALTNNTAYNNSFGIALKNISSSSSISSNTIRNNTYGIYLNTTNYTNMTNNNVYNSTATATGGNIYLESSYYNNLSGNNVSGSGSLPWFGIVLYSSSNNSISGGRVYSMLETGIYVWNTNAYNNITGVTIYDVRSGIVSSGSSYHSISNNIIYDCGKVDLRACIELNQVTNAIVTGNNITNVTYRAIWLYTSANMSQFANNRITNATYGLYADAEGAITFSGNNYILSTPTNGYEAYIDNATLTTSQYNISTTNLDFGVIPANNVTIRVVNLSAVGVDLNPSSISGLGSLSSAKVLQSAQSNYYGLNVTNISSSATFYPKMYYNSSDLGSYSTSNLIMGGYVSSWTALSSSVNTSSNSVIGIPDSSGYFAPLVYSLSSDSSSDNDQSNPSNPSLTISYSTSCEQNTITVKSGSSVVSGVTVKVDGDSIGLTDSNGQITFDGCSKTVIISATKSGYTHDYLTATLVACSQCTPQLECTVNSECNADEFCSNNVCVQVTGTCGYISNHAWVSYSCCVNSDCSLNQKCEEHVCTAVQPPTENETISQDAQTAISNAEDAINKANSEGKNITNAQNKLNEAKAAFAEGNFALAKSLANWAANFANSASANPISGPITPPVNITPNPSPQPAPKFEFGILLLLVPVVIVVGLILYFVFGAKKYGKN